MTKSFRIRRADSALLREVERIASKPGANLEDLSKQIAKVAKAVAEVGNHCADLDKAIEWLVKNAVFTKQS